MHRYLSPTATALAILMTTPVASAAEPAAASAADPAAAPADAPADGSAGVSTSISLGGPKADASAGANGGKADDGAANEKWIKRYRPTRNQMELGIFGGIMLPNTNHELYDPSLTWQSYKKLAPDVGLRFGFYPLSFLGLEVEGSVVPTKLRDGSSNALIGNFRGYGVLQLPYRIAPFLLAGVGVMGTNGSTVGNDVDGTVHFGGGVKFYINRLLALRIDARDSVTAKHMVDGGKVHHIEVLLGLSLLLNRKKPEPKRDIDSDGDGFFDSVDKCVNVPGIAPDGCPAPAEEPDTDGDGFKDSVDACVNDPGTDPDGCPDSDGDGFKDNVDKCPQVPGVAPDGCPPPDTDGDGIIDANDKCIQEPESKNNYQDADGCPDDVPKAVVKFSGVIKGIYFDVDKDTIKKNSKKTLDESIAVLKEHKEVRLEISGHTDSDGNRDHNIDLSARRAEAVRKYLIDAGIDAGRLTSRGAGPDEPVADNKTKAGKALNRRIEFKLLGGAGDVGVK